MKELTTVNDQKDQHDGSFSLTSVGIRQANRFTAIGSKFNQFQDLVSEEELLVVQRMKSTIGSNVTTWNPLKIVPLSSTEASRYSLHNEL